MNVLCPDPKCRFTNNVAGLHYQSPWLGKPQKTMLYCAHCRKRFPYLFDNPLPTEDDAHAKKS